MEQSEEMVILPLPSKVAEIRQAAEAYLVQYPQSGPQNAESSVRSATSLPLQKVYPTTPKRSSGSALGASSPRAVLVNGKEPVPIPFQIFIEPPIFYPLSAPVEPIVSQV